MSRNKVFDFGKNWESFVKHIDENKINSAVDSLLKSLNLSNLKGKIFLDVGCGSGLFSLAAMRLGVDKICSFDYLTGSVNATKILKDKYFGNSKNWVIRQGSVLDKEFLSEIGEFDIVYSWGVLHHTGKMYEAMGNVVPLIKRSGLLYIAIYNDQGVASRIWKKIKVLYNRLPKPLKVIYVVFIMSVFELKYVFMGLLKGHLFYRFCTTESKRGMNIYHDWVDWIGGYPFEVAKPEEIFEFYHKRGFQLEYLKTVGGEYGNNEFVFKKL